MSEDKEKDGGIELLEERHFGETNPWGKPVVGWLPTSEGFGGLQNPNGWASLRVVLKKLLKGRRASLYDQQVIVENPGAIVVCELGDRVGLVRNFRMVADRLIPDAGSEYIRRLQAERRWSELARSAGAWKWEAPRGLIQVPIGTLDIEAFVLKTAKVEAFQEGGFRIEDARIVGKINANSTFFLHSQYVVHARVVAVGQADPEDLEILGESNLLRRRELRAACQSGELDDGLTLGALALCGIAF